MKHEWIETVFNNTKGYWCHGCNSFFAELQELPVMGCVGRNTDNDTLRPPVSERMKERLGFNLTQPYNDDDRNN